VSRAALTAKKKVNAALARATGYELRKVRPSKGRQPKRLVTAPTFILCTLRSGSTLLRVLLDSHSQIHAPQELHLRFVAVNLKSRWGRRAMRGLDLDERALEYLLWDRILHRELAASGKRHIVCKTPNDVFIARRIVKCWPDVRFIFLLRHPTAILKSWNTLHPERPAEKNLVLIQEYCEALERARLKYPGLTVRYEELASDPAATTQRVCDFLGVRWEPEMLDYGSFDHGEYEFGLGDWAEKIKTGQIHPPTQLPAAAETPPELLDVAAAWGYVPEDVAPCRRSAFDGTPPSP
jgi:hypothetical protein